MKLACIPKRFIMTITTQLRYTFTSLPMHLIAQKEKIVMTISFKKAKLNNIILRMLLRYGIIRKIDSN